MVWLKCEKWSFCTIDEFWRIFFSQKYAMISGKNKQNVLAFITFDWSNLPFRKYSDLFEWCDAVSVQKWFFRDFNLIWNWIYLQERIFKRPKWVQGIFYEFLLNFESQKYLNLIQIARDCISDEWLLNDMKWWLSVLPHSVLSENMYSLRVKILFFCSCFQGLNINLFPLSKTPRYSLIPLQNQIFF